MSRTRIASLLAGALAGAALLALMGPVGSGFPSRPRFRAVGINAVAPAQGRLTLNMPASGDAVEFHRLGTARGFVSVDSNGVGLFSDANQLGASIYLNTTTDTASFLGANPVEFAGGLSLSSTNNVLRLIDTNAAADNARWWIQNESEHLLIRAVDDAEGTATVAAAIERTGTTVDSIDLTATAVTVNGVPIRPTIFCTAACNVSTLAVGQSALVVKTTDEAIASDAVYTDDAVLQFLNFPIGSYSYRVGWRLDAGAGGAKAQLNFTGLATDTADLVGVRRCANGAVVALVGAAFTTIGGENSCTGAGSSGVSYEGTFITVASTDDMFTQWAQVASNAATTTLSARSHMHVTRLK